MDVDASEAPRQSEDRDDAMDVTPITDVISALAEICNAERPAAVPHATGLEAGASATDRLPRAEQGSTSGNAATSSDMPPPQRGGIPSAPASRSTDSRDDEEMPHSDNYRIAPTMVYQTIMDATPDMVTPDWLGCVGVVLRGRKIPASELVDIRLPA